MKYIIFLAFLALPIATQAQEFRYDSAYQCEILQKVVQFDSTLSKDIIFEKAREWLIQNYQGFKKTLEIEDKSSGKMMMKARGVYKGVNELHYNFFIECRQGRARVTFSNMYLTVKGMESMGQSDFEHTKNKKTRENIMEYLIGLTDQLSKYVRAGNNDKW